MAEQEKLISLVIIDDHPLVHQGMRAIFSLHPDLQVVGAAHSVDEAFTALSAQPQVALVDLRLGSESGLDVVERGRKLAPGCRFIILTSFITSAEVRRAISLQVAGYLLKEASPETMYQAIVDVASGRPYMDSAVMGMILQLSGKEDQLEALTERQIDVLTLLGRGYGTRDIGCALHITESTVKKHISEILAKLGLADRTQAALYAVSRGLVDREEITFATDKPFYGNEGQHEMVQI